MEFLVYAPWWFYAILGVVLGYFFTPVVLLGTTILVLVFMSFISLTGDWREINGLTLVIFWVDTLALTVSMWMVHLLRTRREQGWLKKIKENILK